MHPSHLVGARSLRRFDREIVREIDHLSLEMKERNTA